jgi:hypothetical protein
MMKSLEPPVRIHWQSLLNSSMGECHSSKYADCFFRAIKATCIIRRVLAVITPAMKFPSRARFRIIGFLIRFNNNEVFGAIAQPVLVIFQRTSPAAARPDIAFPHDFDRVAAGVVKQYCEKYGENSYDFH